MNVHEISRKWEILNKKKHTIEFLVNLDLVMGKRFHFVIARLGMLA